MAADAMEHPPVGKTFIYRSGPWWMIHLAMPVAIVVITVAFIFELVLDLVVARPPWVDLGFAFLWIALVYFTVRRVAFDLEYSSGRLLCRGLVLTWQFPLSTITGIRPALVDIGFEIFETRTRPGRILVCMAKGFQPFAAALHRQNPSITVRIGRVSRLLERMPWPSSFQEL